VGDRRIGLHQTVSIKETSHLVEDLAAGTRFLRQLQHPVINAAGTHQKKEMPLRQAQRHLANL
jgi:hypothetical protein